MFPTLYEIQGVGLHSWGLMVTMAFLAACLTTGARAGKVGIDSDLLVPFYLILTIFALVGARLLHFMMSGDAAEFFANPLVFFNLSRGGFAFYGGLIGGTLSGALYAWIRKIHVLKLADVVAPTIMLGLSLGRVGCFLAGCCHGAAIGLPEQSSLLSLPGGQIVTTAGFPWLALVFTKGVGVGAIHDVPLYPTQVWESVGAMGLFLFLSWLWKKHRRFDGQILATLLVLYAGLRSTIESFRGDTVRGLHEFAGHTLSTSQLVSLGMLAAAAVLVAVGLVRGKAPEQPFVPEEEPI